MGPLTTETNLKEHASSLFTSEGAEPSESALRHQSTVMDNIPSECDRTGLRSQLSHLLFG